MSSEQELIRPADKTVELLLRSFLESETKHREQQTEEHRAINRSLASIGREVADTNSKVIGLDLKFTQHGKDIESLSIAATNYSRLSVRRGSIGCVGSLGSWRCW